MRIARAVCIRIQGQCGPKAKEVDVECEGVHGVLGNDAVGVHRERGRSQRVRRGVAVRKEGEIRIEWQGKTYTYMKRSMIEQSCRKS